MTLWFLSASHPMPKNGPEIPHLDKVAHFGYFLMGGALLATSTLVMFPTLRCRRWSLFIVLVLIVSTIGRLDEYHQGFTPGRSGNDDGDWVADTLGGAAGVFLVIGFILPSVRKYDLKNKAKNNSGSFE